MGIVYGYYYPGMQLKEYDYSYFITMFNADSSYCNIRLSVPNKEDANDVNLSIFPNPANNLINISTSEIGTLTITNAVGQQVNQINITAPLTQLNISTIPAGLYQFTYNTKNGIATRKITVAP